MGTIGILNHRRLGESQEGESAKTTKKRDEYLALESARERIGEINKFHDEMVKRWTIADQRIIGEIVHVEPHGFTRNWALIELYDDKVD